MAGFEHEPALAVLVDIENMARPGARNRGEFDIHLVLDRLAEKGRVVVKRAYADWSRYRDARRELMNAGLELIEMPSAREGAKNRADIKMAVDAMEIAYSRAHVTTFVIVSGDSDFTPLIGKLRELNKQVIGIGRDESSASSLLIANCDVFYFYDSMASKAPTRNVEGVRPDALSLLRETLTARQREGDEHPQASAVKDSMRRRDPAFSESDIGFSTFSKFLEDAQSKGVVKLITDAKSGTYLVELTDSDSVATGWPSVSDEPAAEVSEGRRRRRRRRGGDNGAGDHDTPATPAGDDEPQESEAIEVVAEVFEWQVPDRDPELPPLDQPLTYEDVLLPAEAEPAAAAAEPPTRGSRRRRKALSSVPEPEAADLEAVAEEVAPEEATLELVAAEADTAPADAADAPAEDDAPKRRSRVKRGTVLPAVADEAAPQEASAEETPAPEDDKPKPRRRTTRKKATEEEAAAEATAEAPVEEDVPKPRRRAPRKKATDEAAPDAEAVVSEPSEEEAPKPRRRAPRKKATDEAAPPEAAPESVAAEPATEEEKPKRRRTVRRKATTDEPSAQEPEEGLKPGVSPY